MVFLPTHGEWPKSHGKSLHPPLPQTEYCPLYQGLLLLVQDLRRRLQCLRHRLWLQLFQKLHLKVPRPHEHSNHLLYLDSGSQLHQADLLLLPLLRYPPVLLHYAATSAFPKERLRLLKTENGLCRHYLLGPLQSLRRCGRLLHRKEQSGIRPESLSSHTPCRPWTARLNRARISQTAGLRVVTRLL